MGSPSGTVAGGEEASSGHQHHLELGMQRSSSFLLGSPSYAALPLSLVGLFQALKF